MAEHDIDDQRLEKTLDAMLRDYSDERPRPGLETRVLATLRAEAETQEGRTWSWRWRWTRGAATALGLAGAIMAVYIGRLQPLPEPPAIAVVKAPAVVPTQTLPRIPGHESIAHRDTHSTPEGLIAATPRQEIFPAPSPLSEQEKLLLRYLAGTPHEEVAAQSHGDDATPEDGGVPLPQSREFKIPEVFSTR